MIIIQLLASIYLKETPYEMIDYNDQLAQPHYIQIVQSGSVYRHLKTQSIFFISNLTKHLVNLENYQKIVDIHRQNNLYQIIDNNQILSPLYFVTPNSQSQGIDLIQGDKFKIGKLIIEVLKIIRFNAKLKKQLLQQYSQKSTNQQQRISVIQQQSVCRYCLQKQIDFNNPFLHFCKCQGSTKHIHADCLIHWIKVRATLINSDTKGIYCAKIKGFYCQICKHSFPLQKFIPLLTEGELGEFIVLRTTFDSQLIYVIDLEINKNLVIGRHKSCNLMLNQITVSRNHCRIQFQQNSKRIKLYDLKSRYGTLIQTKQNIINGKMKFQKQKTLLQLTKVEKKSLFDKFKNIFE